MDSGRVDDTGPVADWAAVAERVGVRLPPRYRLIAPLAAGGMADVFRAHDTVLGRDVAIKLVDQAIREDHQRRERFGREGRAAARLTHPNIVAVHDVDPDAGYLVMELVEGPSLRESLAHGPLSATEVRRIAHGILSGLDAAHAVGIVHRDIKPSNIVLRRDGRATLVDFGVARLADSDITRTRDNPGTPAYMAPEQLRGGRIDGRTDLYALGLTLYESLVGERALAIGTPGRVASAKLARACSDRALTDTILRCLREELDERFPTAGHALVGLAGRGRRLRRVAVAVAVAVGVAIAGATAAAIAVWPGDDDRLGRAWARAQEGRYDRALEEVESFLSDHPEDPDALTLHVLVSWWVGTVDLYPVVTRARAASLRPPQRSLVHGIELLWRRREAEAQEYLRRADAEHPGQPEILYAFGEALWHGGQLAEADAILRRTFEIDPRWQIGLHHSLQFHLAQGQPAALRPLLPALGKHDPPAAAAVEAAILCGERRYEAAAATARKALAAGATELAPLWGRLAEALALHGDLDGAEQAARMAFRHWPRDDRGFGGFGIWSEMLLYRGDLDGYLAIAGDRPLRALVDGLWRGRGTPNLGLPVGGEPTMRGMASHVAAHLLGASIAGTDARAYYESSPEPEVRAYGEALAAERRGDLDAALAAYQRALDAVTPGDMRMLLAYHLARLHHRRGERARAASDCDEVLHPRLYEPYRAVLLPDCLVWTAEAADDPEVARGLYRRLVDAWRGSFAHPAVATAHARVGQ